MKTIIKEALINKFVKYNINIDIDVIDYGINILITYLFTFSSIFVVGISFNLLNEVSIFIFTLFILRKNSGGIHFNNKYICYFTTVFVTITMSHISTLIDIKMQYLIASLFLFPYIQYKVGVIEHKNKKLNDAEKEKYKISSFYFTVIFLLLCIILNFFNISIVSTIYFAICTNLISILLPKINY